MLRSGRDFCGVSRIQSVHTHRLSQTEFDNAPMRSLAFHLKQQRDTQLLDTFRAIFGGREGAVLVLLGVRRVGRRLRVASLYLPGHSVLLLDHEQCGTRS